jgi:hypothetical protein
VGQYALDHWEAQEEAQVTQGLKVGSRVSRLGFGPGTVTRVFKSFAGTPQVGIRFDRTGENLQWGFAPDKLLKGPPK